MASDAEAEIFSPDPLPLPASGLDAETSAAPEDETGDSATEAETEGAS